MDITYLIIGFLVGGILGATILFFILKSSMVSRNSFDELNNLNIKRNSDFENSQLKILELNNYLENEKIINKELSIELASLKDQFSTISASHNSLIIQFNENKEVYKTQTLKLDELINENKNIFSTNTELNAINVNLKRTLENEKAEIEKIQKVAKSEFEN
jgi:DNA recombination protein RmuC